MKCIDLMENDLGFVISRGSAGSKTVALHSGFNVDNKKSFKKKFQRLGVAVVQHAKLLGVDYSGGKAVRRTAQRARIRKVGKRLSRYKQLGNRAARHLVKTGAGPSLRYGAASYGATDSAVKAVRFFS